jgi:antagonist of KipI
MSLRIIKAGVLDTVQDAGRYGYRHLGINPTGVMDKYAMQVANILVGNSPAEAVIEMHFPPASFFFEQPALIALSGADFRPTLNADEIPVLQPILVNKFGILQFEAMNKGARAYLSIRGGLKIAPWLNSCSTHLKASAGGYQGRNLLKDDEIGFNPLEAPFMNELEKKEFRVLPWKADDRWSENNNREVLVLPGNEWDMLTEQSKRQFRQQSFTITPGSDRMGYRLNAGPLATISNEEVVSSAVDCGTVQLLPDGKLILLMADHQTTGGYPRVAHVIAAHHSRVAQMKGGDKIRFAITEQQTAEDMMIQQQQHLQQLQNACSFRLQQYLSK